MIGKLFLRFMLGVFTGVGSIYLFTLLIIRKLDEMD